MYFLHSHSLIRLSPNVDTEQGGKVKQVCYQQEWSAEVRRKKFRWRLGRESWLMGLVDGETGRQIILSRHKTDRQAG